MADEIKEILYQARRKQIVDAAIVVISQQGFQRTTIKQIAQQANIADGTIYNYFKNKKAIFFAIMERMAEGEIGDLMEAQEAQRPFATFITDYMQNRMDEMHRDFPLLKAVLPELMSNDQLQQMFNDDLLADGMSMAESYLNDLMTQGSLQTSDSDMLLRLFTAPIMGLLFLRLLGDQHVIDHWQDYTPALIEMLLRAYGQPPS